MAWSWLDKRKATGKAVPERSPHQLRGAPPHARTKTYSAETGHVYQYVYRGYRDLDVPQARDYVFDVRQSRDSVIPVSIRLESKALAVCVERAGRPLLDAEYYAIAKMTLFAGLDEVANLANAPMPWRTDTETMLGHLETLGRL